MSCVACRCLKPETIFFCIVPLLNCASLIYVLLRCLLFKGSSMKSINSRGCWVFHLLLNSVSWLLGKSGPLEMTTFSRAWSPISTAAGKVLKRNSCGSFRELRGYLTTTLNHGLSLLDSATLGSVIGLYPFPLFPLGHFFVPFLLFCLYILYSFLFSV